MAAIELFEVARAAATHLRVAAVGTPIGAVSLTVTADDLRLGGPAPSAYAVSSHARVLVWDLPDCLAELLIVPLVAELPSGMAIEGGWAAVWRVRVSRPVRTCVFEARWATRVAPPVGGPASGQGLAALTWEEGLLELSLGAPDAEAMALHARTGLRLPAAWDQLVRVADPSAVVIEEYLADGLRLRLPELRAGEVGQLHFAVAWSDQPTQADASWFAVDVAPATIARITGGPV